MDLASNGSAEDLGVVVRHERNEAITCWFVENVPTYIYTHKRDITVYR